MADVSYRVMVCGWLQHLRHNGLFVVLRDAYGSVQAVLSNSQVGNCLLPLLCALETLEMLLVEHKQLTINMQLNLMAHTGIGRILLKQLSLITIAGPTVTAKTVS